MSSTALDRTDVVFCSAMQLQAPLRDKVEAAARAGYRGISVTALDYAEAQAAGMSEADVRRMITSSGLAPREFEAVTQWLCEYTATPLGSGSRDAEERNALSAAEALGCPAVVAIHLAEGKVSVDAAAEAFGGLCDRAARRGLNVHLEFLPWTGIADMRTARTIVETAARPNGRLVIDTWHLHRSGTSIQDLAELPPNLVGSVQISDAAAEPGKLLIDETMHSRLNPGDGVIDLVGIIRTLDSIGSSTPLGLEIISDEMNALPTLAAAQRAIEALQRILVQARGAQN